MMIGVRIVCLALPLALLGVWPAEPVVAQEAGSAASSAPNDHLQPGDVVRLRIWREEDLSGEYAVDQDGVAVFPKIGAQRVTEDSPATLREKLLEEYRVYLVNPSIEVWLLRRVNVLGAVGRPGLYVVDPTMTIADALAEAGGALPHGRPDEVELLRDGEQVTANITQQARISELPLRSGDQLIVPERSWFARHSGVVIPVAGSLIVTMINIYAR